ncbi:hypothetical protein RE428_32140 [Marinobacter nanhaiticus D15-8W]|uniref:Uncharacterized protein n=1 Tax=Marinobacter nanhaiticus D15-8W TaxID=626887 RepID=N6WZC2_9GAMM|nr:hypothetical protein [Marinobacter nanhaiticus]ENO16906.1 hypothetical protein J057_01840 [Marinobacter nanhaiticus D15-8W]BES72196.1 hypothetical protein RE428_32140 [Marinobacter nanhaiticus D15-8W]
MTDNTFKTEYTDGFYEVSVEIGTKGGRFTVPALAHKSAPGLAVTMFPFGCFTVTHIQSGSSMAIDFQRASNALVVMSQYALIADMRGTSWEDLDTKAAAAFIKEVSGDAVPFDDCTVTSCGETRKMTVAEWFQSVRMPFPDEFPWEDTDPYEAALENFEKVGGA